MDSAVLRVYSSTGSRCVEDMFSRRLVAMAVASGNTAAEGDNDYLSAQRNSRDSSNGSDVSKDQGVEKGTCLTVAATPADSAMTERLTRLGHRQARSRAGDAKIKDITRASVLRLRGLRGTATFVVNMDAPADFA